jgi:hypothetical protein
MHNMRYNGVVWSVLMIFSGAWKILSTHPKPKGNPQMPAQQKPDRAQKQSK